MFAENLKKLRKARGLTQTVLAEELGTTKGTVSVWERGVRIPDMEVLQRICRVFQVGVGVLLDDTPEERCFEPAEAELGKKLVKHTIEHALMELRILYPECNDGTRGSILKNLVDEVLMERPMRKEGGNA